MKHRVLYSAITVVLCAGAYAAQLPCTIDVAGVAHCAGSTPTPTPTPTPVPTPTPTPTPPPAGGCPSISYFMPPAAGFEPGSMLTPGTNLYVYDATNYRNSPGAGTDTKPVGPAVGVIQVFKLPTTGGGSINFASTPFYTQGGMQVEVAFSKCPGDFTYYKSDKATFRDYSKPYQPCGIVSSTDFTLNWTGPSKRAGGVQDNYYSCNVPSGEQWYLNWHVLPGTCQSYGGITCGLTFGWH